MNMWEIMSLDAQRKEKEELRKFSSKSLSQRYLDEESKRIKEKIVKSNESRIKRRHFVLDKESVFDIAKLLEMETKTIEYYINLFKSDIGLISILSYFEKEQLLYLFKKYENALYFFKEEYNFHLTLKLEINKKLEEESLLSGNGL